MEQTQKIIIYNALKTLERRERSILELYYYAGFSEDEIAESYQISIPRVNQIKKRALELCRKQLIDKNMY
jgi:RNA polymerase sigma factor (sigma-70 family)